MDFRILSPLLDDIFLVCNSPFFVSVYTFCITKQRSKYIHIPCKAQSLNDSNINIFISYFCTIIYVTSNIISNKNFDHIYNTILKFNKQIKCFLLITSKK